MPTADRSIWGIHDFVPDYAAFSSLQEFLNTPDKLIKGGPSGCGWYRIVMPFDELARHGWRTGYAQGTPPAAAALFSIVVAQRTDRHEALPSWRKMTLKHRLVYELDDDVFSVDPVNTMAHQVYSKPEVQDAVLHSAQVASLVTVTTEPLAEVMRTHTQHRNIRVLPNCVPGALLDMDRPRDRRHVIIGWAGGASHGLDMAMIAGTLRHVLDENKRKARLHLIGVNYGDTIGREVRYTHWIPSDATLRYYQQIDFDIALCPLTGTVFDQSKSNIKALEAMALGIPVLASDTEPYRGTVIDGVNGYLCRRKDWGRRLHELINDEAAREEMGAKARETARAHTIEANWHRWADAYSELL